MNFWQQLKKDLGGKPILCLAPMADVTDRAFRQIIAKYSKPNPYVTWTEFVSADGLFKGGYDALINDLAFTEIERPIVAQFFTSSPEMMEKAASLALELGFDGVDINMGCPDKSVEKGGAGAALIKNPELAKEIILAAKRGAKSESGGIPVSVKTRIGYNKDELETWLPQLLSVSPAVITIHARTRKEMSLVPARWERVKRAVEIRDAIQNFPSQQSQKSTGISLLRNSLQCSPQSGSQASFETPASENLNTPASQVSFENVVPKNSKTLIFGNGDVLDIEDAYRKAEETGADGVMIGRGIFGNPWLFTSHKPSIEEKLRVFLEQAKLFEKIVGPKWPAGQGKSFAVMKKHLKAYCEGFPGCKELRTKMMEAKDTTEMEILVNEFLMSYN